MITLPNSELHVSPLCLGGNVFGWSADVNNSEKVLDHFVGNGGNFIDTTDMYSQWVEGAFGWRVGGNHWQLAEETWKPKLGCDRD